jgi:hypothetical protein
MTQRREIDWQTRWLEVTITKTKTLLFLPPAPESSRATKPCFFLPPHPNSDFPVGAGQVSAKLENLIFNHHTRLRFGGSQDHAKQKIFRIEIALEAC